MKTAVRKFFSSLLGVALLTYPSSWQAVLAEEGADSSAGAAPHCHHHDSGCSSSSSTPVNLDLSSTVQSVTANHIASPVDINVGGASMAVTQGMALTPAQLIAAYQMAHTGQQSLLIGADGAAIGGSFILGSRLANHINDLVIPAGVSVIDKAASLNLAGNLTNAGSIYAVSNNSSVTTASISAANILNQQSGLLSTVLPTSLGLDLSQYSSVLNLSLSAINNIINYGTITSAGNLTATAGGSIQNLLANPGAAAPVMQALAAMNLQAPQIINQGQIISQLNSMNLATSSLVNAGVIQSLAGSINIAGLTSSTLNVNNIAGEITARDAISMVTSGTTFNTDGSVLEKAGIEVNGGALTAPELNFTSPDGVVTLDTDRLNGGVNIDAGVAAAHVQGGTLNITNLTLTGDPIFTNSNGDVAISDFDAGGTASDFIVLATGNITANPGTTSVVTSGGNVVMSAGYLFTGSDSNCADCTGLYTISRTQSSTGGSINLTGVTLNASGVNGANGIDAVGTTPATDGGSGGNGGSITLQSAGAIQVGTLQSDGGSGGAGGNGNNALVARNGANGGRAGNGGNIDIYSSAAVTFTDVVSTGGAGGDGGNGGATPPQGGFGGAGGSGGNGGNINITAVGAITINGFLSTGTVQGGNGGNGATGTSGNGGSGGVGGYGGNGGAITLTSERSISLNGSLDTLAGNGGAGGNGGFGVGGIAGNGGNGGYGGNGGAVLLRAGSFGITSSNNSTLNNFILSGGGGGSGGDAGGGGGGTPGAGGNGGNGGLFTVVAEDGGGIAFTATNIASLAGDAGAGGTGGLGGLVGKAGSAVLAAADPNGSGITISSVGSNSSSFDVGSLVFITGYGSASNQIITKVLPISGYGYVPGDLTGAGVIIAAGTGITVANPVTIVQNTTGSITIDAINNTANEGVYTASNGSVSAGSGASSIYTSGSGTVAGRDLVVISNTGSIDTSTGGTVDVSSANGDAYGGQIIIVSGLNSGFVTPNASYSNPFMKLSPVFNENIVMNDALLKTNSSMIFVYSLEAVANIGGANASGLTPTVAGASGMPGGLISLAGNIAAAFDSSSAILSNGADGAAGAAAKATGGNGGMGGILRIGTNSIQLTGLATSLTGGAGGAGFGGASSGIGGNGGDIKFTADNIYTENGISVNGANGGRILITLTNPDILTIGSIGGGASSVNGALSAVGTSGNGGIINLQNGGGIEVTGVDITAEGIGIGGGTITLSAAGSITLDGGALNAGGSEYGGSIDVNATGSNSITLSNSSLLLAPGTTAGTIRLSAPSAISVLGSGSAVTANGITYGGRIDILTNGTITNQGNIAANSNTGAGNVAGKVQISSSTPGAAAVTLVNSGTISATNTGTNTTGRVGINGGTNDITITGSGTLRGGEFVNIGNLNSTTLAISSPFTVVTNFSGVYNQGNISITQGAIIGTLQVSGVADPVVVPATPASAVATPPVPFNLDLYLLYISLLQQLQDAQTTNLNEQLGTRLATDYTPYTTYPMQPNEKKFPLEGALVIHKASDEPGEALFTTSDFNVEELSALSDQGITFGSQSGGNFLDLSKGYVLFTPTSDIKVQTKEGLVYIPKGSAVWVMETGNDAAVYDLHDSAKEPVRIVTNGKEMTLSPGTEILMTRDSKSNFESLNPGGVIGTRNVRSKDLGGGIKAYIADFSISGSLMNISTMRQMLKSDDPEKQKTAHKMLKNAAILSDLGGYKTPYKTKP